MQPTNPLLERIESLVRTRSTTEARLEIIQYIQTHPEDTSFLFFACDWYRRLGLYREGLRLVLPSPKLRRSLPNDSPANRKKMFWVVHFLNLLGANAYALDVLTELNPVDEFEHRTAGNVYFENYQFPKALFHFEKMVEFQKLRGSTEYSTRVSWLGLADTLAGMNQFESAKKVANEVLVLSPEPYLKGICLQALGEYEARDQNFEKALAYFSEADPCFPDADKTIDRGFLLKWLGFTQARLGNREEAKKIFCKAERILKNPTLRPEVYLDFLRLKYIVFKPNQNETLRLHHYPAIAEGLKSLLPDTTQSILGPKNGRFFIHLNSEEWRLDGNYHIHVPLEIKLLAALRMVQNWGISPVRLKIFLWPKEAFSFFDLDKRLAALVRRLRKQYCIEITIKQGLITLSPKHYKQIGLCFEKLNKPAFFKHTSHIFLRKNFCDFYNLSASQGKIYLKKWINQGFIKSNNAGPASQYFINNS